MYSAAILAALPALALAAPAPLTATVASSAPASTITAAPNSVDPNKSNPTVAAFLSSLVTGVGFNEVAASYIASEFAKPALSFPGNEVGTATEFLDPFHAATALTAPGSGPAIFSLYQSVITEAVPSGTARDALESVVSKGLALASASAPAEPVTVTITAAPECGRHHDANKSNPTVAAFLSSLVTGVGFNEVAASYIASEFAKPALSLPGNEVGTATEFLDPFHAASSLTAPGSGPAIFSIYQAAIPEVVPSGTARDALESVVSHGLALATLQASTSGPAPSFATVTPAAASSQTLVARAVSSSSSHGAAAPRATGLSVVAAAAAAGAVGLAVGL